MRSQRQPRASEFSPKQRKSSGSQKSAIMKKSWKEYQMSQMHMKTVNKNTKVQRGKPGSRSTSQPKDRNVRGSRTLIMSDSTQLAKGGRKSDRYSSGIESLRTTQLKAMPSLVHKDNMKECKKVVPSRVDELRVLKKYNSGERKERYDKAMKQKEPSPTSEVNVMCDQSCMQKGTSNGNEAPSFTSSMDGSHILVEPNRSSENKSSRMFGRELTNFQRDKTTFMEESNCATLSFKNIDPRDFSKKNLELCDEGQLAGCDDKRSNRKTKRSGTLLEGNSKETGDGRSEGVVHLAKEALRSMKKRKQSVITQDGDDHVQDGVKNHNHVSDEDGTTRTTSQDNSSNDFHAKAPMSLCMESQCYYCSKPIDEPTWRGIFKIDGKKYLSLAGHLSTKFGEKVRELSRLLLPVVELTKHSRPEAWPKRWEASKPNGKDIGLYFFPHEMRPNEDSDQLVKEVMENDLVLRAVIGEAEMLIFPSILLPKRYQTFQTKYYLWGVFKPREDKDVASAKALNVTRHCANEVKETRYVSDQQDAVLSEQPDQEMILTESTISLDSKRSLANSTQKVRASNVQRPPSRGLKLKAPEDERQGDALLHIMHCLRSNKIAPDAATINANDVQVNPQMELPQSNIIGFVVPQTQKVVQLIREMEREGAVVVALQGAQEPDLILAMQHWSRKDLAR